MICKKTADRRCATILYEAHGSERKGHVPLKICASLVVQENTHFPCIYAHAPYLRHILKSDNPGKICNKLSEQLFQ